MEGPENLAQPKGAIVVRCCFIIYDNVLLEVIRINGSVGRLEKDHIIIMRWCLYKTIFLPLPFVIFQIHTEKREKIDRECKTFSHQQRKKNGSDRWVENKKKNRSNISIQSARIELHIEAGPSDPHKNTHIPLVYMGEMWLPSVSPWVDYEKRSTPAA